VVLTVAEALAWYLIHPYDERNLYITLQPAALVPVRCACCVLRAKNGSLFLCSPLVFIFIEFIFLRLRSQRSGSQEFELCSLSCATLRALSLSSLLSVAL
jgi:hypothetical protein